MRRLVTRIGLGAALLMGFCVWARREPSSLQPAPLGKAEPAAVREAASLPTPEAPTPVPTVKPDRTSGEAEDDRPPDAKQEFWKTLEALKSAGAEATRRFRRSFSAHTSTRSRAAATSTATWDRLRRSPQSKRATAPTCRRGIPSRWLSGHRRKGSRSGAVLPAAASWRVT